MLVFNEGFKLTTKGMQMISSGTAYSFTKIVLGAGIYENGENPSLRTALKNQQQVFDVSNISIDGETVTIAGVINNTSLTKGYNITEMGVIAKDNSNNEHLFLIGVASVSEQMPAHKNNVPDVIADIKIKYTTSNTAAVSLQVPETAFARAEDFNKEVAIRQKQFDSLSETIGDKNELPTEDKSSLVNAIKEVFTSGNEKKQNLVTNLIAMGVTCSISESWESLLAKVLDIVTGTDISDTTAIASHVLETDYFYNASGVKTKGTMVDRSCVNRNELDILNPSHPRQTIHEYTVSAPQYGKWGRNENREGLIVPAPSGYFNNVDGGDLSYVYVPASSLRSRLGITADKILQGQSIAGVAGTAVSGKKFASGYIADVGNTTKKEFDCYRDYTNLRLNLRYLDVVCDFEPSTILLIVRTSGYSGVYTMVTVKKEAISEVNDYNYNVYISTPNNNVLVATTTIGTTTSIPYSESVDVNRDLTWYAFE